MKVIIDEAMVIYVLLCCSYFSIAEVKEVFDLFDFWDGRDGLVDGFKVGEVMRCIGLNPTNKVIYENGGTKKLGRDTVK